VGIELQGERLADRQLRAGFADQRRRGCQDLTQLRRLLEQLATNTIKAVG
jgi:hypothetical protein